MTTRKLYLNRRTQLCRQNRLFSRYYTQNYQTLIAWEKEKKKKVVFSVPNSFGSFADEKNLGFRGGLKTNTTNEVFQMTISLSHSQNKPDTSKIPSQKNKNKKIAGVSLCNVATKQMEYCIFHVVCIVLYKNEFFRYSNASAQLRNSSKYFQSGQEGKEGEYSFKLKNKLLLSQVYFPH